MPDTRLTALLGEALAMPRQVVPLFRIWKRIEITSDDSSSRARYILLAFQLLYPRSFFCLISCKLWSRVWHETCQCLPSVLNLWGDRAGGQNCGNFGGLRRLAVRFGLTLIFVCHITRLLFEWGVLIIPFSNTCPWFIHFFQDITYRKSYYCVTIGVIIHVDCQKRVAWFPDSPDHLFLLGLGSKCAVEIHCWYFEASSRFWGRPKWFK